MTRQKITEPCINCLNFTPIPLAALRAGVNMEVPYAASR